MGYRDERTATRERIAAQRQTLRAARAAVPPEVFERLPQADAIRGLEDVLVVDDVADDELDAVMTRLDALADAFELAGPDIDAMLHGSLSLPAEATQSRLPETHLYGKFMRIEEWPAVPPSGPVWNRTTNWLRSYVEEVATGDVKAYQRVHESVDRHGRPYESRHQFCEFSIDGMPVHMADYPLTLTVPVRPNCPSLFMRPEGMMDGVAKLFGRRDAQVGDHAFDTMFLIDGDDDAVRLLLPPEVRTALTSIASFDVPVLNVENALARIRFTSDGRRGPFLAALKVLRHLHDVKVAPGA